MKFLERWISPRLRPRLFISRSPQNRGGGSNTFAWLFCREAKKRGFDIVGDILKADQAVIVAFLGEEEMLQRAKAKGVFLIHRLDEHFVEGETGVRKERHEQIRRLNRFADVTVYQSNFVFENVHPHLNPGRHAVIHNGGDPDLFFPAPDPGAFIGHVSWSVGDKKRLDLLSAFIDAHPKEQFLLVGRHAESSLDFRRPNVTLVGPVGRERLPALYRRMKMLFFPSENDPCPNTVIEALLSGVPVCYHPVGGSVELVRDCGEPLDQAHKLMASLPVYRQRCRDRADLHFSSVFARYMELHDRH